MDLVWETAPGLGARKYGDLEGARGSIILRTFLLQRLSLGGGMDLLLGSSAPTNRELLIELSCAVPMRTLHQRGSNKLQTPNPGEE
jgi:hypothetical protein